MAIAAAPADMRFCEWNWRVRRFRDRTKALKTAEAGDHPLTMGGVSARISVARRNQHSRERSSHELGSVGFNAE
jgi:hypothetical protein